MTAESSAKCMEQAAVERIGTRARQVLSPGTRGRVLAVFHRCFYVETDDGALACIGEAEIGAGPLNALVQGRMHSQFPSPGSSFAVTEADIQFPGGPSLSLREAREWHPQPWMADWTPAGLAAGLRAIAPAALILAPDDGLAGLVAPGTRDEWTSVIVPRNALEMRAGPAIASFTAWLDTAYSEGVRSVPEALKTMLGLGPGLTPSGDDFLGGALIALAALGCGDAREALAAWIRWKAPDRTGKVSKALLDCAADGLGAESLHQVVAAVLAGREDGAFCRLITLGRVGHTSGWDALAGAVVVLGRHRRHLACKGRKSVSGAV